MSEKLRTVIDALEVSNVIAVRDPRDNDHRRANANVASVSVAADRTLIRSRSIAVRVTAIAPSIPAIVRTRMSSGRA